MLEVNPLDVFSKAILQQGIGQSLRAVEGLLYVSPGLLNLSLDDLDQLRLILGSQAVRFRCSSDGETLTVDGSDLCPSNLGEYGELRRTDLSKEIIFSSFMNAPLRQILLLNSHEGRHTIGVTLEFGANSLVICNWGDELKVWNTIPESLFEDEGIQIKPA